MVDFPPKIVVPCEIKASQISTTLAVSKHILFSHPEEMIQFDEPIFFRCVCGKTQQLSNETNPGSLGYIDVYRGLYYPVVSGV